MVLDRTLSNITKTEITYIISTLIITLANIFTPSFAATYQVSIATGSALSEKCVTTNSCFDPDTVNINPGDTVTWTNIDDYSHTTINGHPPDNKTGTVWDSSVIKAGGVYSFTFQNTGTYDYFCQIHPWMTGQVIVGNGTPASLPPISSPITSSPVPSQVTSPPTPTLVTPSSAATTVQSKTTANAAIMTMIYGQQFDYSLLLIKQGTRLFIFQIITGEQFIELHQM